MKTKVQLTSKQIEDLKNSDNVGFIDKAGIKGYAVFLSNETYICIDTSDTGSSYCNRVYGNKQISLKKAIKEVGNTYTDIDRLYRFDTRKELYQWLSE